MSEMPHHNGAQQKCLLCRQPIEIQEKVLKMVRTNTYQEIAGWLDAKEIEATWSQVRYFASKFGKDRKKYIISPKKNYLDKLNAYINELLRYEGETYTIHVLHMRGSSWTWVTANLHSAGLIEPLREYPPIQWKILGTKNEISEWRASEVARISDEAR